MTIYQKAIKDVWLMNKVNELSENIINLSLVELERKLQIRERNA